jgi:sterol-4alpha-carboxylate 3-dehydrogenase (decarboxylating)
MENETPRIIVTGGLGFYGRHIIPALKEQFPSCEVFVLDIADPKGNALHNKSLISKIYRIDITCKEQVQRALYEIGPVDAIVHTAGLQPPLGERYRRNLQREVHAVNVEGTRNVVDVALETGCRALVYTSSCCVVTDDLHGSFANINEDWPSPRQSLIYGESKVAAEELVLAADGPTLASCVLRPAVTLGEGDYMLLPSIHACIVKGETPFRLGDGMNLWDVVYVGNVAYAHALAVRNLLSSSKTAHGEAFVSCPEKYTFNCRLFRIRALNVVVQQIPLALGSSRTSLANRSTATLSTKPANVLSWESLQWNYSCGGLA